MYSLLLLNPWTVMMAGAGVLAVTLFGMNRYALLRAFSAPMYETSLTWTDPWPVWIHDAMRLPPSIRTSEATNTPNSDVRMSGFSPPPWLTTLPDCTCAILNLQCPVGFMPAAVESSGHTKKPTPQPPG